MTRRENVVIADDTYPLTARQLTTIDGCLRG